MIGTTSSGPCPGHVAGHDALLDPEGRTGRASPDPWVDRAEAWAHCFRHPGRQLPQGLLAALPSESDFKDPDRV